jgi:hypothetical protein
MPNSDDQYRLNSRQRREIDQIGQKFHFNLGPPPGSLDEVTTGPTFVSLAEFIEDFDWRYSDLDIIDRLEIKQLALENFWRYIAKSEVPIQEPGLPVAGHGGQGHRVRSELVGLFYRSVCRLQAEPG